MSITLNSLNDLMIKLVRRKNPQDIVFEWNTMYLRLDGFGNFSYQCLLCLEDFELYQMKSHAMKHLQESGLLNYL